MAFPTQNLTLAAMLQRAQSTASALKRVSENDVATMAAGQVTWSFLLALLDNLREGRSRLNAAAGTTGIAAYAQEQLGVDVAPDFVAMTDALDAAINHIVVAIPKDGSGRLLVQTINAQSEVVDVTFSAAQTATLRGLLDDIALTIE